MTGIEEWRERINKAGYKPSPIPPTDDTDVSKTVKYLDAPSMIVATPFIWRPPAAMPRRQWLYGRHLIRRFMSCTIAPGGVGKSALTITEALAMVTGRPLLGPTPVGRLRVWLWNGEDPTEEIERRLMAAALHFGIDTTECEDRLFVDSGRVSPIILAEETQNGVVINAPVFTALKTEIRDKGIDAMTIDPFVSSHRISENDNMAIDKVAKAWAQLAEETDCAFDL